MPAREGRGPVARTHLSFLFSLLFFDLLLVLLFDLLFRLLLFDLLLLLLVLFPGGFIFLAGMFIIATGLSGVA